MKTRPKKNENKKVKTIKILLTLSISMKTLLRKLITTKHENSLAIQHVFILNILIMVVLKLKVTLFTILQLFTNFF